MIILGIILVVVFAFVAYNVSIETKEDLKIEETAFYKPHVKECPIDCATIPESSCVDGKCSNPYHYD